jgi:hypothetical protein
VNYNNGENSVTYFGALLFNDTDILMDAEDGEPIGKRL